MAVQLHKEQDGHDVEQVGERAALVVIRAKAAGEVGEVSGGESAPCQQPQRPPQQQPDGHLLHHGGRVWREIGREVQGPRPGYRRRQRQRQQGRDGQAQADREVPPAGRRRTAL